MAKPAMIDVAEGAEIPLSGGVAYKGSFQRGDGGYDHIAVQVPLHASEAQVDEAIAQAIRLRDKTVQAFMTGGLTVGPPPAQPSAQQYAAPQAASYSAPSPAPRASSGPRQGGFNNGTGGNFKIPFDLKNRDQSIKLPKGALVSEMDERDLRYFAENARFEDFKTACAEYLAQEYGE